MGPAELVAPLQLSAWWYVAACAVLLAAVLNLFAPLLRAAAGSGAKSLTPTSPSPSFDSTAAIRDM